MVKSIDRFHTYNGGEQQNRTIPIRVFVKTLNYNFSIIILHFPPLLIFPLVFLFQTNYSNKLCSKFKVKFSALSSLDSSRTSSVVLANWQNLSSLKCLHESSFRGGLVRNYSSIHTQQPAGPVQEMQTDPYIILDEDLKYVYDDIRHVSTHWSTMEE